MPRTTRLTLAALTLGLGIATAASAAETIAYTYDARGRLIKVEHSGSANHGVVTHYSYDKADNRTNVATDVPNS